MGAEKSRWWRAGLVMTAAVAFAPGRVYGEPLPLTDNAQPPFLGVYETGIGPGIKLNGLYSHWLNRSSVWGMDTIPFGDGSTWDHISGKWGEEWFFGPWSAWTAGQPNRQFIFAVPLLPGGVDGSGPKTGDGAGKPVSLAEGATGAYDGYWAGLARALLDHHLDHAILRLGWEWNGTWYAWKVVTLEDAHNFAAYWRHIVDAIRSVHGAENLKFDWNVSSGLKTAYDYKEAYPGDDYVDYIGIDVYDETWVSSPEYPKGFYPLPPGDSDSDIQARHEAAWKESTLAASNLGIEYWQKFADDHHKQLTIPEWGLIVRPAPNDRGGGDDPFYVQRMYEYIQDPAHHVYFASYFDCDAGGDGNSLISGLNGKPVAFPKSQALYRQLFSLPGSGTPTP